MGEIAREQHVGTQAALRAGDRTTGRRLLWVWDLGLLPGAAVSGGYPEEAQRTRPENRTPEQKQRIAEYREEQRVYRETISRYNLIVASISIGAAVLVLVGSIVWLNRLPVIGDGATLGAVFTLFYGLIRAFTTNDEQVRFVAVAIGLAILLSRTLEILPEWGAEERGVAVEGCF